MFRLLLSHYQANTWTAESSEPLATTLDIPKIWDPMLLHLWLLAQNAKSVHCRIISFTVAVELHYELFYRNSISLGLSWI